MMHLHKKNSTLENLLKLHLFLNLVSIHLSKIDKGTIPLCYAQKSSPIPLSLPKKYRHSSPSHKQEFPVLSHQSRFDSHLPTIRNTYRMPPPKHPVSLRPLSKSTKHTIHPLRLNISPKGCHFAQMSVLSDRHQTLHCSHKLQTKTCIIKSKHFS